MLDETTGTDPPTGAGAVGEASNDGHPGRNSMKISAVRHSLPSAKVTNADLVRQLVERNERRVPTDACEKLGRRLHEFLISSGAETRYHRAAGERAFDFGVNAARAALEEAGIGPGDIDVLLFVGVGRGFLEPATANVFQTALGLERATCSIFWMHARAGFEAWTSPITI